MYMRRSKGRRTIGASMGQMSGGALEGKGTAKSRKLSLKSGWI
jgi:hypothetical protein